MSSFKLLSLAALVALAQAHSQILKVQGKAGSPASTGFGVDPNIARNCTSINPCQQDTAIIRDAEIQANTVNECGRTEIGGNIDIGENTENAIAAGAVTQAGPGEKLTVTLHQVNADGAGPYACDLIEEGNNGRISQNLTVQNNVPGANGFSQDKFKDFEMTVIMPQSFNCQGASTGNVCTVRCRNNAQAGPFGGCFPVQQANKAQQTNNAKNIKTKANVKAIEAQVAQNKKDFNNAVAANQAAGTDEAKKADALVKSMLAPVSSATFPTQTPSVDTSNNNGKGFGGNQRNSKQQKRDILRSLRMGN